MVLEQDEYCLSGLNGNKVLKTRDRNILKVDNFLKKEI